LQWLINSMKTHHVPSFAVRIVFLLIFSCLGVRSIVAGELKLATFEVDASPAIDTPMAYDLTREVTMPLSCRGVVLLGMDKPIVLCAVDWIGIANEANVLFREKIAEAAGTTADRVVVHTLHQHDAPRADVTAMKLMREVHREKEFYDPELWNDVLDRVAQILPAKIAAAKVVRTIGVGQAEVIGVASNRRILDAQGRVAVTRFTACQDPAVRELPVGVIDPMVRTVVFFGDELPIAALTYYATHPQSYYRTGEANPDFPGMARNARQAVTGVFHLHFNGAGGNIGAGKYNDGSKANRQTLAEKLEEGMKQAWASMKRQPVSTEDVQWSTENVRLPVSASINIDALKLLVADRATLGPRAINAAEQLAFATRMAAGNTIPIGCLRIGNNYVVHMPGELFVEYQIAARELRPKDNVLMAAYGDYGPFYIGTRVAYPQGGYEVGATASNVSPDVEDVLMNAMAKLLNAENRTIHASDFTERFGPGAPPATKGN
jgi:hypothetical protein